MPILNLTAPETAKALELCKGRSPYQCQMEAEACEKEGAYITAAVWFKAAAYASIGRTRTEMYEEACAATLRKAGR